MKRALVLGTLSVAACGLAWSELSAESPLSAAPSMDVYITELRALVDGNPSPEVQTVIRLGHLLHQSGQQAEAERYYELADRLDSTWRIYDMGMQGGSGKSRANNTGNLQDVWVCSIPGLAHYTSGGGVNIGGTLYRAYSFATTSANQGNAILNWDPNTVAHPVITQNLYRLLNGRFEQVGQAWLKHGFCALQNSGCGTCKSAGGGCPPRLGPGCADPYDASLNGTQSRLGPKSEVSPHNSNYVLPHATGDTTLWGTTLRSRLIVRENDLAIAGASYWFEGQYVHPEDAWDSTIAGQQGNTFNNVSYRGVTFSAGTFGPAFSGSTVQQQPAINAWKVARPSVTLINIDNVEQGSVVPNSGGVGATAMFPTRYRLGYDVIDNGNGTWTYNYAVFNMNSDKGVQSFGLDIGANVQITNAGMSSPFYHSGDGVQLAAPGRETYSNSPWAISTSGGEIRWSSETLAQNVNANALRWGTTYSFWFTANTPPTSQPASFVHFKDGSTSSFSVVGPSEAVAPCPADLDGDGQVGASDLAALLGSWGGGGPADFDGGGVSSSDLAVLLGSWGPCN